MGLDPCYECGGNKPDGRGHTDTCVYTEYAKQTLRIAALEKENAELKASVAVLVERLQQAFEDLDSAYPSDNRTGAKIVEEIVANLPHSAREHLGILDAIDFDVIRALGQAAKSHVQTLRAADQLWKNEACVDSFIALEEALAALDAAKDSP